MLRTLLSVLVIACATFTCVPVSARQGSGPLTNQRIIDLTHSGMRSDELTRLIATAPSVNFDLSPSAEQAMMQAGVSEETIRAMAAREQGVSSPGTAQETQPTPVYQPSTNSSPSRNRDDIPHMQLFVGGSYFRVHASGAEGPQITGLNDFELGQQHNLNFPLYGWHLGFTENVNRWFGADVDVAGAYGSPKPSFLCSAITIEDAQTCFTAFPDRAPVPTKLHTFMLGPRFSFRRYERIVPFVHVLLGVGHINGTLDQTAVVVPVPLSGPTVLPKGFSRSDTSLAVAPGAGIDYALNHLLSIRLIEIDYVMTRFFGQRQDNGRASVGLIFQFGSK